MQRILSRAVQVRSIFPAATTLEAGVKVQRRQQWNLAIDGDKQERERREDGQEGEADFDIASQSVLGTQEAEHAKTRPVEHDASTAAASPIEISEDLDADLERNLDSSAYRTFWPLWPVNTGPKLNEYHLPPQSIYARDVIKRKAELTRWSEKKLLRAELCIDMLQLNFFQWLHHCKHVNRRLLSSLPDSYANIIEQHPVDVSERSFAQKKSDFDRLLHTQKDGLGRLDLERSPEVVRLCSYIEDDLGVFRQEQAELRHRLETIFHGMNESQPLQLCKVFHLLSSSSAPPNVDIYNTLIRGLRRKGPVSLTNAAITSFFSSKVRPNEVSLAVILDFYTETDNASRFRHVVQLMRGQHGGLMQSAPWNWRFKASNGRIIPHPHKEGQLIQLPHQTPMVLDAIVKGILHFSGFDAALGMCRNLGDEGWGMGMRGFGILLNDCARRGDWDAGFAIWSQIVALKQKSSKSINGRSRTETITTPLFADMLRLCRRCDKKQAFADVWEQAKQTHPRTMSRIAATLKAERSDHSDGELAGFSGPRPLTKSPDSGGAEPELELATEDGADARQEALEALARLRATRVEDIGEGSLQQEYLALKADVDFLKAFEGSDNAEQPKVRSWAELARNAYSLIASHPTTLERRIFDRSMTQTSHNADGERPVTYTDLAKNAYHLVADHPSTMDRRKNMAPRPDNDNVYLQEASYHTETREPNSHPVNSTDEQQKGSVTYTSLAKSAYRLIADPSSTLERRDPNIERPRQELDGDIDFMSKMCEKDVRKQSEDESLVESQHPVVRKGTGRS